MINKLRNLMKKSGIDAVIIPTADPHMSEYIPEHYKLRKAISGFTGSAGELVVTMEKSGLWTDGRYYIQAEKELSGSGIELFRASEKETPKIHEFLKDELKKGSVVGVDGSLFSKKRLDKIISELDKKSIGVNTDFDSFSLWENRPAMPDEKIFVLPENYCGESVKDKLFRVRNLMKKEGYTHYLINSPESVMWLFNIRGGDVEFTPVALSYALVSKDEAVLFADLGKASEIAPYLKDNGITLLDYSVVTEELSGLGEENYLATDFDTANFNIIKSLGCAHKDRCDFVTELKCIRTESEIENIKKAYIKENTALVKSFYEIYHTKNLKEYDAVEIIEKHRRNLDGYFYPSFGTIAAFGKNAAMAHYSPDKINSDRVEENGLLLIDTGGQYLEGTTDTTRMLVMGEIEDDIRDNMTLVLKGNISIATLKFPKGKTGRDIDSIAREPLWSKGLDFNHGTGHGIGYLLGVHEGPQRISPMCSVELKENMTLSDEPGVYIENGYGVRIENHLCVKEYNDKFLCFEVLNYCPIGTKGINPELLEKSQKEWLNEYNSKCRVLLKPYLTEEEYEWLTAFTQAI